MATNKKISELPEFTAAQLADDDLIVMVDVSDSTTKKVQASTFRATVSGVSTLSADAPLSVDAATGDVTVSLGTVAVAKGGTGAADAATARTNLGLAIGTDVQAYDAGLTDIAGLAVTDGNIIVGDGANWVAESGATARTSLGLGTIATQDANNVNITGGTISGIPGIGDVAGPASSTDNAVARFDSTTGKLIQNSTVTVSDTGDVAAASLTLTTDLAVADGGTGASDAAAARTNLGLGSISTQAANNVTITGGSITGITDLAVADGGTGASDAATARNNLGLGSISTQDSTSVNIDGGTIDGTTIGGSSAAGGTFSALTVSGTTGQVATVTTSAGETQFTVTGGAVDGRLYSTSGGSQFIAGTFSNHPVTFYSNSAEKMRLTTAGYLGLGETSVNNPLHVKGGDSSLSTIIVDGTAAGGGRKWGLRPGVAAISNGYFAIYDETASAARFVITDTGELLINTTSSALPAKLEVHFSGSATQGITIKNTANSASGAAIRFVDYLGNYSGGGIYYTSSNSITYATTSDYRLKENVVPTSGAAEKVKQLNPVNFNFIGESESVDGFLAHELQAVVPNSVIGEKDAVTESGENKYQAADYAKLVPLLTAALKEALNKIETLEARVASLEAK